MAENVSVLDCSSQTKAWDLFSVIAILNWKT
jgi:hypothetical protein